MYQALQIELVFKAHRLVYHSTLGVRVMKKKKIERTHRRQLLLGFADYPQDDRLGAVCPDHLVRHVPRVQG